jgi:hypothetical protein
MVEQSDSIGLRWERATLHRFHGFSGAISGGSLFYLSNILRKVALASQDKLG